MTRTRSRRRPGPGGIESLESRTLFDASPIDTAFGAGGRAKFDVAGLAENAAVVHVLPDGKILVAGDATFALTTNLPPEWATMDTPPVTSHNHGYVARLNPDGSLDATFGENGIAPQPSDPYTWVTPDRVNDFPEVNRVEALAVGPDGAIYLGGTSLAHYPATGTQAAAYPYVPDQAFAVVAYNADGTLRTTFGHNGVALADMRSRDDRGGDEYVEALAVQADGKVIAVGSVLKEQRDGEDIARWDQSDIGVVRFDTNGSIDPTFGKHVENFPAYGPGLPRTDRAAGVALAPDGKVVVLGTSSAAEGAGGGWALLRYNPDGTRDATFGDDGRLIAITGFGAPDPSDPQNRLDYSDPQKVLVQPDGRILAFGTLGVSYIAMMRFTPEGALDGSFGNGGKVTARGIDGTGYDVHLRDDSSISVAGAGMGSDWVWIDEANNSMTTVQTGHEAYAATFDASGRRIRSARAVRMPVVANESVWRTAVAPDGKILAVGQAYPTVANSNPAYGDTADALVMRFDPSQFSPDGPDTRDVGGEAAAPAYSGRATVRAGKANTFRLTYTSADAARRAQVFVTGPDGSVTPAQLMRVKSLRGGAGRLRPVSRLIVGAVRSKPALATYRVAAPGGRYDAADNGTYAVKVATAGGNAATAAAVGQFTVAGRAGAHSPRRATEVLRDGEGETAGVR